MDKLVGFEMQAYFIVDVSKILAKNTVYCKHDVTF